MNSEDRELGMGRAISRRDFFNGVAVAAGTAAALTQADIALAQSAAIVGDTAASYPPMRYGLRGDHPGSFPAGHALRDGAPTPDGEDTRETYDLVVVGAGLSGLAAAWFYRERAGPSARILVLDNHDDFGGHAKRNEYVVGDRKFMIYGGSNFMVSVDTWPHEATRLIKHLGIQAGNPADQTHPQLYPSLGMTPATFFRKEVYGKDELIPGTINRPTQAFLDRSPLPTAIKADLMRLWGDAKIDYLPGLTIDEKIARLRSMSYRDYLVNVAKFDPGVLPYVGGAWCLPNDGATAWFAYFRYKPGFAGLGVTRPEGSPESPAHQATNYGTPGGNHSICRLMVRDLIPDALPPGDFVKVETERLNYATLDRPGQATRLRLSSTVVRARHVGAAPHLFEPDNREVEVTYVTAEGKAYKVVAKDVVMAGFSAMVPYICPELPTVQKSALSKSVRAINVATTVMLRNWEAFARLKANSIAYPRSFYNAFSLPAPRSFGAMKASMDPSQPILASFSISHGLANEAFHEEMNGGALPALGTPIRDQFRTARTGLFRTPYDRFERALRSQSAAALGAGGFDPARDILAITVNRWGHGYALGNNTLYDPEDGPVFHEVSRTKFGHITIAGSDASGIDNAQTAIDEAARAVRELEPRMYGYYGVI